MMDPTALHQALSGEDEIALIDVREEGHFGSGHILVAANAPLSRLELDIGDRIPRRSAPVVLCDGGGEGLAERAQSVLAGRGYTDVAILEGGTAAWAAAGYQLFTGINVPSKAFGEYVEHHFGTPRLAPRAVAAAAESGRSMVIVDSRPFDEYRAMNIPGGIDLPGAELVHRIKDIAPAPDTLVVVNCAGRTRSIIGAQSLINAGLENDVVALENGTMGWHLAGLTLERGADRRGQDKPPSALAARWGRAAADRVAERFGVTGVSWSQVEAWREESDRRTLYLLDVRQPEEFAAGHVPGSVNAQGGQLVQATDRYVATRNARLVLVDDTGTRARMTASWLVQMGWRYVYVLDDDLSALPLEAGAPDSAAAFPLSAERSIDLEALDRLTSRTVIDLASSLQYRQGHIPGARWAIRSQLADVLQGIDGDHPLVLTCPDGRLSVLAARDIEGHTARPVSVLGGGTAVWQAAGRPLDKGFSGALCEPVDVYHRPYDREEGVESAMRDYLTWEVGLIEQIRQDNTLQFPDFPE